MPIDVDASQAPGFLRWSIRGPWPGISEMGQVRQSLIAGGQLTTATRALFDLRYVETVPDYDDVNKRIDAPMVLLLVNRPSANRSGGTQCSDVRFNGLEADAAVLLLACCATIWTIDNLPAVIYVILNLSGCTICIQLSC